MASAPTARLDRRSIDFYVQATAKIGMGHLSRAGALVAQSEDRGFSCRLIVDADDRGRDFAESHHLVVGDELLRQADVLVIDAVDVPTSTVQVMNTYPTRILTSPVFRRADLATHVLVRDAPQCLVDLISANALLEIDPRFAFTTAHGVDTIAQDFTEIRVGLCLTAGTGSVADQVLACLLAAPGVAQVAAIGDIPVARAARHGDRLRHVRFAADPWRFLEESNVFIGGDGVMVGEAVARALPTFSVTTRARLEKNRTFIDAGAIEPVLSDNLDCQELQHHIMDRDRLQRLHYAARACYHPNDSQALTTAIERICDGRQ